MERINVEIDNPGDCCENAIRECFPDIPAPKLEQFICSAKKQILFIEAQKGYQLDDSERSRYLTKFVSHYVHQYKLARAHHNR